MHEFKRGQFVISTDKSKLQLDRVHGFLAKAYWSAGIPRSVVDKAAQNSITFGVYTEGLQIGYARWVSDLATFAWMADVYIEESHRGQGLSKWLVECMLSIPEVKGLRRLCLATKDAHGLYKQYGFIVTETPGNWMEIKDNEIYRKQALEI